jgi:hypothetical protein
MQERAICSVLDGTSDTFVDVVNGMVGYNHLLASGSPTASQARRTTCDPSGILDSTAAVRAEPNLSAVDGDHRPRLAE